MMILLIQLKPKHQGTHRIGAKRPGGELTKERNVHHKSFTRLSHSGFIETAAHVLTFVYRSGTTTKLLNSMTQYHVHVFHEV